MGDNTSEHRINCSAARRRVPGSMPSPLRSPARPSIANECRRLAGRRTDITDRGRLSSQGGTFFEGRCGVGDMRDLDLRHVPASHSPASPPRWPIAAAAALVIILLALAVGGWYLRRSRSLPQQTTPRAANEPAATPAPSRPLGGAGRRHRAAAARRHRSHGAAARGPPVDASGRHGVAHDRWSHPQCDRDRAERGRRRDAGAPSATDRAAGRVRRARGGRRPLRRSAQLWTLQLARRRRRVARYRGFGTAVQHR